MVLKFKLLPSLLIGKLTVCVFLYSCIPIYGQLHKMLFTRAQILIFHCLSQTKHVNIFYIVSEFKNRIFTKRSERNEIMVTFLHLLMPCVLKIRK